MSHNADSFFQQYLAKQQKPKIPNPPHPNTGANSTCINADSNHTSRAPIQHSGSTLMNQYLSTQHRPNASRTPLNHRTLLHLIDQYLAAHQLHHEASRHQPSNMHVFPESGAMMARPVRDWGLYCVARDIKVRELASQEPVDAQMRRRKRKRGTSAPKARKKRRAREDSPDELLSAFGLAMDIVGEMEESNALNGALTHESEANGSDTQGRTPPANLPQNNIARYTPAELSALLKSTHQPSYREESLANQAAVLDYATLTDQWDSCWEDFMNATYMTKRMKKFIEQQRKANEKHAQTYFSHHMATYFGTTPEELLRFTSLNEYLGEDRPYLPHDIITNHMDELEQNLSSAENGLIHVPFDLHEYHLVFYCPADMTNEELVYFLPGRTLQDLEHFISDADKYGYRKLHDSAIYLDNPPKSAYGNPVKDLLLGRNMYSASEGVVDDFSHRALCYHWSEMEICKTTTPHKHCIHTSYCSNFSGAIVEVLELGPDLVGACSTNVGDDEATGTTCVITDLSTGRSLPMAYGNTVWDMKRVGRSQQHFVTACEDGALRVYKIVSLDEALRSAELDEDDRMVDAHNRLLPVFVGDSHNGHINFLDWSESLGLIALCSEADEGVCLWRFDEDNIVDAWDRAAWCTTNAPRDRNFTVDELFFGTNRCSHSIFGLKEGSEKGIAEWQLHSNGKPKRMRYLDQVEDPHAACVSPEGDCIFYGTSTGAVGVVDLQSGSRVFCTTEDFSDAIVHMAVSDQYLAVGGRDFSVMVYDLRFMGRPLQNYRHRVNADIDWQGVNRVAWNHTSGRLLCSVADDQCTRLWDVTRDTSAPVRVLQDEWRVNVSKFSLDDMSVMSGNDGNRVSVYSIDQKVRGM